jgi:hypothetical protein
MEKSALFHGRLLQTKDKNLWNSMGSSVMRPQTGHGAVEKKKLLSLQGIEPKIFGSVERIVLTVR